MSIALADLVDPKQITLNLRAETQEEAIREIVGLLVGAGKIDNPEKFLEQLKAREAANSTYAANGVAFPHARTKLVDEIVVGIGQSEAGIPWTGKGEVAHLIFLIAVPERLISDYLVVVGAIARATRVRPLRTLLLHAENVDEFIATLLSSSSIRLLQKPIAGTIENFLFRFGQAAHAGLGNLVQNRIDRSVDIIRLDHAARARLLHNG